MVKSRLERLTLSVVEVETDSQRRPKVSGETTRTPSDLYDLLLTGRIVGRLLQTSFTRMGTRREGPPVLTPSTNCNRSFKEFTII